MLQLVQDLRIEPLTDVATQCFTGMVVIKSSEKARIVFNLGAGQARTIDVDYSKICKGVVPQRDVFKRFHAGFTVNATFMDGDPMQAQLLSFYPNFR